MANGMGRFSMRDLAAFAGGAVAAIVASRLLPPLVSQASGRALAAAGRDPFDTLVRDHRRIQSLLDKMERSPDGAGVQRTQLLLRLKRELAAHALAEEDVIYPLLHARTGEADDAEHLYGEHADMKMHLYSLEDIPKDDPAWRDTLRELKSLIEGHIRQEEQVDFPRLRDAMDEPEIRRMAGRMQREKSFIL